MASKRPAGNRVLAAVIPVMAVVAGAIHLAHNYLPMGMPAAAAGTPAQGTPISMAGAPGGLMGLVMSHLSEVMILNCVAFVGLAIMFVVMERLRSRMRLWIDALLVLMSGATLYAWSAMGRSNPYDTGTLALVAEVALIVFAIVHVATVIAPANVPGKRELARA